ncbi:hypothetical protein OUZ56_008863 [Daphnia magna]|uniref:Uncharacterized protein n=1 Tax=Daphnia magna TaxID=35525 RepID=A0ABR0AEE1_9CRUS|nr:hypothetical protein OUZ56_008863 [Daphnia magna]
MAPGLSVSPGILNRTEPLENYLPESQPIGHFLDRSVWFFGVQRGFLSAMTLLTWPCRGKNCFSIAVTHQLVEIAFWLFRCCCCQSKMASLNVLSRNQTSK